MLRAITDRVDACGIDTWIGGVHLTPDSLWRFDETTGRLLPTGQAVDELEAEGLGRVAASCVDAANPCVFVAAASLGKTGVELPDELEADTVFLERMEAIRPGLRHELEDRRGMLARVIEGGEVALGDPVEPL